MATIAADGNLVVIGLEKRTDTILVSADEGERMACALVEEAGLADAFVADATKAGRVLVPTRPVAEPWEARVGLFDRGVAVRFNRPGTRVPLPPEVARELARRVRFAVGESRAALSFRLVTPFGVIGSN
jgi:hypothetical protein